MSENFTTTFSSVPLLKQTPFVTAVYSTAYTLIFLLAVLNNSAVLAVIRRNVQMRTVTNCFIANLACSDLIVALIVLPMTLFSNIFYEWPFGRLLCKAVPYLQAVAVSASVNTQAAVAIERYCVIFYPSRTIINSGTAAVIIASIWIFPLCIQVPWMRFYTLDQFPTEFGPAWLCYCDTREMIFVRIFILGVVCLTCYLLPLTSISIFYSMIGMKVCRRQVTGIQGTKTARNIQASKIRIVRMLVTVAAVFALSWLPLYCLWLRNLFGPKLVGHSRTLVTFYLLPVFQWLSSTNSCVNPFIYCFFSYQFRGNMLNMLSSICAKLLPCCLCEKKLTYDKKNSTWRLQSHEMGFFGGDLSLQPLRGKAEDQSITNVPCDRTLLNHD